MDWKVVVKKLLFPPAWLTFFLSMICAAALAVIFVNGMERTIGAYVAYVFSFYALCVLVIFLVRVLPKQYIQIKQKVYENPLTNRYVTDRTFRTHVSLWVSFGVNLLYVGINLFSWYMNRSWWFVVLAVYYVIMASMRCLLVRSVQRKKKNVPISRQWKRCRICGCVLLLINLVLSAAVLMILYQSKGYDYPGIMIYVMALYTFYSTVHAVVDMIRLRKFGNPVMTTAKIISLSAALVSMLNLETAMFAQFGAQMPLKYQKLMIVLTGAGVSIIVVTLSVMLIVRATKEIRRTTHG